MLSAPSARTRTHSKNKYTQIINWKIWHYLMAMQMTCVALTRCTTTKKMIQSVSIAEACIPPYLSIIP